jgi:multidrug efflux pump subunit AcrB
MPAGASVKKVDAILKSMEKELEKQPFIESVFTMSGGKTWGLYTFDAANEGELNIQLVPKSERSLSTDEFIRKIMPLAKKCVAPGGKMPVKHMRIKGVRKTGDQEVEIKVKGTDIRKVFDFAVEAAEKLRSVEGLSGVNISMDMTKPEYRIYVDRAKASALGISVKSVAETLQALVHGIVPTRLRDGSEYYDIRVMVPEEKIKSKADLEGLVLENRQGKKFFVRDIAEVRRAVGPVEIARDNQAKMVVVRADAHGVSVGEAVRRADEAVGKMNRPPGVFYEMGGQAQMMREMNRTVLLVIVFAVFFAFVALAVQFESLKLPFLVLLSLPPVLAGMLWGLKFTGLALGATVAIGALIVISATINDGVLLLSFAEELRLKEKLSAFSAVLEAAAIRLRPRLMTTFSTIAGFTPLALNWGEGGDLLQPMAVAAISGLLFEIFVTLFLLPCLYCIFSRKIG